MSHRDSITVKDKNAKEIAEIKEYCKKMKFSFSEFMVNATISLYKGLKRQEDKK